MLHIGDDGQLIPPSAYGNPTRLSYLLADGQGRNSLFTKYPNLLLMLNMTA